MRRVALRPKEGGSSGIPKAFREEEPTKGWKVCSTFKYLQPPRLCEFGLDPLKKEFLELLEKDVEFRYAVAGYLGLSEVLKRLDALAEEQVRLREEMAAGFRRHDEEMARLREEMVAGFRKFDEEMARLREDFNRMYRQVDARLSRIERTLEKITIDIEEEARVVVRHRLRDMGYDVDVSRLVLPGLEVNLYGASGDLCVVGEASVRASSRIVDELNRKVERLRELYPDRLRPRVVKVVYASLPLPDLVERAEAEGVWVLGAAGDVVKPRGL